ncbi:MAG: HAMP domain-containing histidine kinase [Acidobacteria bacterium]|nr:HAMP domain-containing histidine kinase [Acidobacteriota bacterium]
MRDMEERRGEIKEALLKIVELCRDPMFCFDSNFKIIKKSSSFEALDSKMKDLIIGKSGKVKPGIVASIKNSMRTFILKKGNERYILHITPFCSDEKEKGYGLCSLYPYKFIDESNARTKKREFLRIMAHELKSPLSNIGLCIDYILLECQKDKKGVMKKICPFVKKMKKQSLQVMTMIDNYLDISKFKEGFFEASIERFLISDLVEEIKELGEPLFLGKEIEFSTAVAKNTPEEMESDSELIKRILINFIANAAKFTEAGSVKFEVQKKDRAIVFSVSDTGCGIEKDEFNKIFEPFKRGRNVGKRSPGFGLGLSIAKKLASVLKGTIEVESTPKKGSTFLLKIPIYEEK